jgi:hypothetical protein
MIKAETLIPSFKLAEKTDLGPGGIKVPQYPGAAFLAAIVEWANETGQMPDEVYEKYLKNPQNFKLLFAYRSYRAEKEREEIEKAKKKG